MHVFLTGRPGVGKTTVIRQTLDNLPVDGVSGFYTRELRRNGKRVGFEAVGLGGTICTLAHVEFTDGPPVSRYTVDVESFNRFVNEELPTDDPAVALYVIDEIGKMECYCEEFVDRVRRILAADTCVLGTVAARGRGLIRSVKQRNDVKVVEVAPSNRDQLPGQLVSKWNGKSFGVR